VGAEHRLISVVGRAIAPVGDEVASVGVVVSLVGGDLTLVGEPVPLVGCGFTFVGQPLTFVGESVPLVGQAFSFVGGLAVRARRPPGLGRSYPLLCSPSPSEGVGEPEGHAGAAFGVALAVQLPRDLASPRRPSASYGDLSPDRQNLFRLLGHGRHSSPDHPLVHGGRSTPV
jgi:hypothetical protein